MTHCTWCPAHRPSCRHCIEATFRSWPPHEGTDGSSPSPILGWTGTGVPPGLFDLFPPPFPPLFAPPPPPQYFTGDPFYPPYDFTTSFSAPHPYVTYPPYPHYFTPSAVPPGGFMPPPYSGSRSHSAPYGPWAQGRQERRPPAFSENAENEPSTNHVPRSGTARGTSSHRPDSHDSRRGSLSTYVFCQATRTYPHGFLFVLRHWGRSDLCPIAFHNHRSEWPDDRLNSEGLASLSFGQDGRSATLLIDGTNCKLHLSEEEFERLSTWSTLPTRPAA